MIPANLRWAVLSRIYGGSGAARRLGASVGDGCRILSFNVSSEPFLIEIGDRVTIATGVHLITHDGAAWLVRDGAGRRYRFAPIWLRDDVFVGLNSIILPGVSIGPSAIVAAGSVVTRSVPTGVIVAGNPARIIGSFSNYQDNALTHWVRETDFDRSAYRKSVVAAAESEPVPPLRSEE